MPVLSPQERKVLKARAHSLAPAVRVGGQGLTDPVIAEIERALQAHELIKVRAAGLDRAARESALRRICGRCGAAPVQHIGKLLVIYRPKPPAGPLAKHRSRS
jgi:putative YhbY family RNA-binding protein